jgi:flagellar hook-length control protein FliK
MASAVQNSTTVPLPEASLRPSQARGTGRRDEFGARLDEAASAQDRVREPSRPVSRQAGPRDVERQRPDRAARADTSDETRQPVREPDRSDAGANRAAQADRPSPPSRQARTGRNDAARQQHDGDDDQDLTVRPADRSISAPAPDTLPTAPPEGTEVNAVTPAEANGAKEAGKTGKDEQDAASPSADPALAALMAALGDAVPAEPAPPVATAPAPAAVALLQPVPAQPVETQPAAQTAAQDDVAALAVAGTAGARGSFSSSPRTGAARQQSPDQPVVSSSDAADESNGTDSPAPAQGGFEAGKAQQKDASARDGAVLPDMRLPGGAGKGEPGTPPTAAQAGALTAPQPAPPAAPATDVATAGATAAEPPKGDTEAGKDGAARTGRAGETKAAGEVPGSDKASSPLGVQRELQITTFSLDPASAGQGPMHAAGLHRDTQAASQLPAPGGQPAAQTPAVPVQAVPIEIGMRVLEGAQQFTVRLHPEDLGRVDVRIGVDDDGKVTAQLVVDKVETLAMLQRDSRTLERAFDQAGLKTSEGSLQFTLNNGAGQQQAWSGGEERRQQQTNVPNAATKIEPPEDLMAAIRRVQAGPGGLDIRI